MKKLLLGAVAIIGFFAGPGLIATGVDLLKLPYSEQMAFIREEFSNLLEGLGGQSIATAHFNEALSALGEVRGIINFQAKNSSISASNKQKLGDVVLLIEKTLIALNKESDTGKRVTIAKNAIKTLESKLKTLNVGLTDYQTTIDLKNGLKRAIEGFLKTLRRWALITSN